MVQGDGVDYVRMLWSNGDLLPLAKLTPVSLEIQATSYILWNPFIPQYTDSHTIARDYRRCIIDIYTNPLFVPLLPSLFPNRSAELRAQKGKWTEFNGRKKRVAVNLLLNNSLRVLPKQLSRYKWTSWQAYTYLYSKFHKLHLVPFFTSRWNEI